MADLSDDPRIVQSPEPESLVDSVLDRVTVPLQGKMYDVELKVDNGRQWIIKTLREDVVSRYSGYRGLTLEQIFEKHIKEYETTERYLGDFLLPTTFYIEELPNGKTAYRTAQMWVPGQVQYKVDKNVDLEIRQLPSFEERIKFCQRLAGMLDSTYESKLLPDLDFFILRFSGDYHIVVFDSTGFFYDKQEGKDRMYMVRDLVAFLFPIQEELDLEQQINKEYVINRLYGAEH